MSQEQQLVALLIPRYKEKFSNDKSKPASKRQLKFQTQQKKKTKKQMLNQQKITQSLQGTNLNQIREESNESILTTPVKYTFTSDLFSQQNSKKDDSQQQIISNFDFKFNPQEIINNIEELKKENEARVKPQPFQYNNDPEFSPNRAAQQFQNNQNSCMSIEQSNCTVDSQKENRGAPFLQQNHQGIKIPFQVLLDQQGQLQGSQFSSSDVNQQSNTNISNFSME